MVVFVWVRSLRFVLQAMKKCPHWRKMRRKENYRKKKLNRLLKTGDLTITGYDQKPKRWKKDISIFNSHGAANAEIQIRKIKIFPATERSCITWRCSKPCIVVITFSSRLLYS